MKKIKLFFAANLPFWAALMGLQAVSTDVTAQAAPKKAATVKPSQVSPAAKAAVKAAGVKAAGDKAREVFVREEGPSFVKSGAVVKPTKVVKDASASFVSESGPSFVKSSTGAGVKDVKAVNVKGAAVKAAH